jgi:hypothetical protein
MITMGPGPQNRKKIEGGGRPEKRVDPSLNIISPPVFAASDLWGGAGGEAPALDLASSSVVSGLASGADDGEADSGTGMGGGGLAGGADLAGEADEEDGAAGGAVRARGRNGAACQIGPAGLIRRAMAERYVQLLAEGLEEKPAWLSAGGSSSGGSARDRNGLLADPVFQARRKMLEAEKVTLESMGPHGEALWCAKQTFRAAQLKDDLQTQMRAAQLIATITEKIQPSTPGDAPGPDGAAPRAPGRPASEAKQTKVNFDRLRMDLQNMGLGSAAGIETPVAPEEPVAQEEDLPL